MEHLVQLAVVLAGLGLLGVLAASLGTALAAEPREPALVALLVAASGTTMLGVGSAFWGLVAGIVVSLLLERPDFAARGT